MTIQIELGRIKIGDSKLNFGCSSSVTPKGSKQLAERTTQISVFLNGKSEKTGTKKKKV